MENSHCAGVESEEEVTDAGMWLGEDKVVGFCGSFHFTVSIFSMKQEARLLTENEDGGTGEVQVRGQESYENQKNGGGKQDSCAALKGPLEVSSDEIKVKLVSAIVFFFSHIQRHGSWCEEVGNWLESGLWFSSASMTKGEESRRVESVCKGVIVMIGQGKDGRKQICGLKNCQNQSTIRKYGSMKWYSECDMFKL